MNWLRRFMMGRYGTDQLSIATLVLAMVVILFARGNLRMLSWVGLALLAWCYYRMLSRNISARAGENGIFLGYWNKVKGWWNKISARLKDRDHRYYRCPQCGQELRVPRGRGKIAIHCPRCNKDFVKKT